VSVELLTLAFERPPIDWHAFAPEITLLCVGALITLVDIVFLERARPYTAALAGLGVLATLIPILTLALDGADRTMFGGAYVVDDFALVTKARWAVEATGANGLCLGGGVAANSRLRERFLDTCGDLGVRAFLPSHAMCTDNAAMVAAAGWWRLSMFGPSRLDTGADPNQGLPLID